MDDIDDFIENVCDDLSEALTDLYYNKDDCDEKYQRVRSLIKLISYKADKWTYKKLADSEQEG